MPRPRTPDESRHSFASARADFSAFPRMYLSTASRPDRLHASASPRIEKDPHDGAAGCRDGAHVVDARCEAAREGASLLREAAGATVAHEALDQIRARSGPVGGWVAWSGRNGRSPARARDRYGVTSCCI